MALELLGRGRVGPGLARRSFGGGAGGRRPGAAGEFEAGLPAADQFEIDLGGELAVELGAVLLASREVDVVAPAQRVEAGRRSWKALARHGQRIHHRQVERLLVQAVYLRT